MSRGALQDVANERRRQIEVEGWTPKHDDNHTAAEMAIAAACYILYGIDSVGNFGSSLWNWTGWARGWFKPKDRRSNLVRAAALLLAEIERLDRANG